MLCGRKTLRLRAHPREPDAREGLLMGHPDLLAGDARNVCGNDREHG
jgi:hypothetical protein